MNLTYLRVYAHVNDSNYCSYVFQYALKSSYSQSASQRLISFIHAYIPSLNKQHTSLYILLPNKIQLNGGYNFQKFLHCYLHTTFISKPENVTSLDKLYQKRNENRTQQQQ